MKKTIIGAVVLMLLASTATFAKPVRITFKRGAKKAVVSGSMTGFKSRREFVLRLRAGQTLDVSSNKSITLTILDPSGEDLMDRDLGCNGRASISPTVAGDYKIIVTECLKADPWRGTFKLFVSAH
jgi:hypothetical protein